MHAAVVRDAGRYQCATCPHKHCTTTRTKDYPQSRGAAPYKKFKVPGFPDYDSSTCFLPELDAESYYYYSLYLAYCDGFLPVAGGILDQPNDVIEAKELLKAWHARTAQP